MFTLRHKNRAALAIIGMLALPLATAGFSTDPALATASGMGHVHSQDTVSKYGITVSPTVEFVDGIIRGNLHATSATGQALAYSFIGSSNGGKLNIGNVPVASGSATTDPQSFTILPYATWLDGGTVKGTQTFTVRVSPVPGAGMTAKAAAKRSATVVISVNIDSFAPNRTPLAFTYGVKSFDGIKISANFFPASGLVSGATANAVLEAPGLGVAGITNPYATHAEVAHVPGPGYMRQIGAPGDAAYNVISWDVRGTYASGGTMQFGNPFFDGRDVSALIDWISSSTPTTLNGALDPAIGIVGSSLGASTALTAAATDPRVDGIVSVGAWTSMDTALNPNGVFRATSASSILATLNAAGARVNAHITAGLTAGIKSGELSDDTRSALASTGPSILLNQIQAPAFLVQGTTDATNRLEDSNWIAQQILANPYGTPVKMAWFDPNSADVTTITTLFTFEKAWLNKYVAGVQIPDAFTPNFQWWDQHGTRFTSDLYPFGQGTTNPSTPGFNSSTPITVTSAGGTIKFASVKKGVVKVTSLAVPVTVPAGKKVVGTPTLSFDYTGTGSAKAVFARLINAITGAVVGSITMPVPVTLDGNSHSVNIPLANVVYTVSSANEGNLTLQILSWVRPFSKHWSGRIDLRNVSVAVPLTAQ